MIARQFGSVGGGYGVVALGQFVRVRLSVSKLWKSWKLEDPVG